MSYFQAILLGILQGLTEFLPVSSSGHLVLAGSLLGIGEEGRGVTFELAVHLATLLSVLIYFRRRLFGLVPSLFRPERREDRRLIFHICIGTIPVVLAGLFLKKYFEATYESPLFTSVMLCVTGIILFLPSWLSRGKSELRSNNELTPKSALLIGIGQAFAILPGISRSGSTIVAGMLAGVSPAVAAEFSFLLAVPAIAGAGLIKATEMSRVDSSLIGQYIAGSVAAFILGLVAVYAVLTTIRKGKFQYFGYYCLAIGLASLLYFTFRG